MGNTHLGIPDLRSNTRHIAFPEFAYPILSLLPAVLTNLRSIKNENQRELLNSIRKRDLVLSEFQREYVWSLEQAKQLMIEVDPKNLRTKLANRISALIRDGPMKGRS